MWLKIHTSGTPALNSKTPKICTIFKILQLKASKKTSRLKNTQIFYSFQNFTIEKVKIVIPDSKNTQVSQSLSNSQPISNQNSLLYTTIFKILKKSTIKHHEYIKASQKLWPGITNQQAAIKNYHQAGNYWLKTVFLILLHSSPTKIETKTPFDDFS
jgi:glycosyltransferase involved in cell wall biosynthesis